MNQRHEQSAHIVPDRNRHPEQRRRRTPHTLRRLVVEELQMPDRHKSLGDSVETVLRNQPEKRDRDHRVRFIQKSVLNRDAFAFDLNESGDERCDYRDHESDSHAVEERDASLESGEFSGDFDEDAVVEDDC